MTLERNVTPAGTGGGRWRPGPVDQWRTIDQARTTRGYSQSQKQDIDFYAERGLDWGVKRQAVGYSHRVTRLFTYVCFTSADE